MLVDWLIVIFLNAMFAKNIIIYVCAVQKHLEYISFILTTCENFAIKCSSDR